MGRTSKNTNKAQNTQQAQAPAYVTMDALEVMLKALKSDIEQMINDSRVGETPKAQPVAQPKADEDEKVWFVKKNGERKLVSAKQAASWEARRNRVLTEGQKQTLEAIKSGKLLEPERTRKLEKELGVKVNSFANTAVSVKQALEAGWKPKASDRRGRKDELASIKAKIRG